MSRHRSGFELSITTVASRLGILRRRTASHFCDYNYSTTGLTTTTFYHFVLPFSFFLIFRGIRQKKKKKKNEDKNIGGKLRAHVYIMLFFSFYMLVVRIMKHLSVSILRVMYFGSSYHSSRLITVFACFRLKHERPLITSFATV